MSAETRTSESTAAPERSFAPAMCSIFSVTADRSLATGPDTTHPWGARVSNVRSPRWNQLVFEMMAPRYLRPLNILDLGCAGGGWVRDCIDWGHDAVGIDGSDWGKVHGNGEWRTIPDRLFTADITERFEVLHYGALFTCDLITSFEVMEHIEESGISGVCANIHRHLRRDGLFICSVNPYADNHNGMEYHATVKPLPWWEEKFKNNGLYRLRQHEHYFAGHFLRGPKHPISGGPSLVLSPHPDLAPPVPSKGALRWALDHWLGSLPQRCLQYAVCGPTNENR